MRLWTLSIVLLVSACVDHLEGAPAATVGEPEPCAELGCACELAADCELGLTCSAWTSTCSRLCSGDPCPESFACASPTVFEPDPDEVDDVECVVLCEANYDCNATTTCDPDALPPVPPELPAGIKSAGVCVG